MSIPLDRNVTPPLDRNVRYNNTRYNNKGSDKEEIILGGTISIEDGEQDTHTGLATLGLQAQSEAVDTTSEGLSVESVANATAALAAIDSAIETVSTYRAGFGATENRLDSAISNLTTYQTNLEASKGRILDADFATETSKLTKAQILQQAATSMLAQANASKQGLLALLQG